MFTKSSEPLEVCSHEFYKFCFSLPIFAKNKLVKITLMQIYSEKLKMLTHYEGRTKTDRNRSPNSINHSDENRSMFLKGNSNDLGKKICF